MHLVIVIPWIAAFIGHEIEVDGLGEAPAADLIEESDRTEVGKDAPVHAALFAHLAYRCLGRRFAAVYRPLRELPAIAVGRLDGKELSPT